MQSSEVQNNAVPVEAVEPPPAVDVAGDDMDASTPSAENENSTNDTNVNPDRRLARAGARSSWSEIFMLEPEGRSRRGGAGGATRDAGEANDDAGGATRGVQAGAASGEGF